MKQTVKKLVFTEMSSDNEHAFYKAESLFGWYYINHNKKSGIYTSSCDYTSIGESRSLIEAIKSANRFHTDNIINSIE